MESPRFRDVRDRLARRSQTSRRFPPNGWSVDEVERRLSRARVEWAYVFDDLGQQVVRRRGSVRAVSFTAEDVPHLRDATVVHNHPVAIGESPAAFTFSRMDLVFAVRFDIAEMRVVAATWRFVLIRPATGWPVDEEVIGGLFDEFRTRTNSALRLAVLRGELVESERESRLHHEVMVHLAEWGGWTYRREMTTP